ncbi:MAG: site-specific integrase, partial [Ilumatobacter sp.]
DLDTGSRTLSIQRSVASIAGGTIVKDTKTHAARRIALDDDTIDILERQRARLEHRAETCELAFNQDGYVFTTTADGTDPLHPDTITGAFSRVCRSQGVKGIRLHDLRHLHATQLLAAGVPVRTVSGRLGHANASTTLNVYAHFLEASDREAADVIGNLLGPSE